MDFFFLENYFLQRTRPGVVQMKNRHNRHRWEDKSITEDGNKEFELYRNRGAFLCVDPAESPGLHVWMLPPSVI